MTKELVLVAPRLLARSDEALATMRPLARLTTYADDVATRSADVSSALFTTLGMPAATPVAPLALLGAGGDPGGDYILCAQPVHLRAGSGRSLDVAPVCDLSAADADALIRMFDRHFQADDLRFEARQRPIWFARRAQPSDVTMTSPEAARSQSLAESLPRGEDGAQWRRWQDEIAMLLHDHPVNATREAASALVVNALWFFGGGRLADVADVPPLVAENATTLVGDVARGLALQSTTRRTGAIAGDAKSSQAFVVAVADAGTEDDALARALARLESRAVDVVHLIASGRDRCVTWRVPAPTAWRRLVARARPLRPFHIPTAHE